MTERSSTSSIVCGGVRWRLLVEGQGPALLAVHGTGSSADSYRGLARALAPHFTVVRPDLPGHASSRPEGMLDASLPGMAASLGALLAHEGLEPELVMGHSAGAAVLARMVLDHLVTPRLFVGIAPAIVPLPRPRHALLSVAARMLHRSRRLKRLVLWRHESSITELIRGMGSTLDAEGLEHYRRLAARPEHLDGVLQMLSSWDVEPVYRALERISTRSLLVVGSGDRAVPVEHALRVAERLRRGRFVAIPGAGHLVHEERPEELARLVLEEWHSTAPHWTSSRSTSSRSNSSHSTLPQPTALGPSARHPTTLGHESQPQLQSAEGEIVCPC